jgi:dTDP-4-dehydrorhamnose reductase
MTRVLVLGTTGMLGAMVLDWLRRDPGVDVAGTARTASFADNASVRNAGLAIHPFDVEQGNLPALKGVDWVVNCIGIIKPYIRDDNRAEVLRAIQVNSFFPMRLAEAAERSSTRVLQIATDCVYSGRDGKYTESAPHDATDVYGKTKSLGEVRSHNVTHLRCSIIGPEVKGHVSLLSWFLKQQVGATLNGYRNHQWNGVTTLHFAKVCWGIIKERRPVPHVQHVVPANDITKADLLRSFAREYAREDLTINEVDTPSVIDRRVRTANPELNQALWQAAGYDEPPTVEQMVAEMAAYGFGAEWNGALRVLQQG